jgi:hypothetical protein
MTQTATSAAPGADEKNGTPIDCGWPTAEFVEDAARKAKHVVEEVRQTAEEMGVTAADTVRRHPLAAVGAAVTIGAALGCLFGLGLGLVARSKR